LDESVRASCAAPAQFLLSAGCHIIKQFGVHPKALKIFFEGLTYGIQNWQELPVKSKGLVDTFGGLNPA